MKNAFLILVLLMSACASPTDDIVGRWQYWKSTDSEGKAHINFIPNSVVIEYFKNGKGIERFRYSNKSQAIWKFRDTTIQFSYSYKDDQLETNGLNGFGDGAVEFLENDVHVLHSGNALFWFRRLPDQP